MLQSSYYFPATNVYAFMLVARVLAGSALVAAALAAQPAQTHSAKPLEFDVASIKLSDPSARGGGGIRPLNGGQTYVATNIPVRLIFKLMYRITDSQIVGGTDWFANERYDIEGKTDMKGATIDQLHEMFQTLLADRFALKFHKESRQVAGFELTVDKSGPKMKVSELPNTFDIPLRGTGRGKVAGERVPMDYLAWFFSQQLNQPVINKTGLDKFYDFTLEFAPPGPPPAPGADARELPAAPDGLDLFGALREQLGLKLESKKVTAEVFVIDRVERPSAN
jgi:uncharacterized protein (TIGR03435 family)